jgi:antitoxin Phd
MKVYSYSEARQRFADVLRQAKREGQAQIRRRDGELFLVQPALRSGSPLDVPGVESGLTARQLVNLVRTSRRSMERLFSPTPADTRMQPTRAKRPASKRAGRARG